MPELPEVEVVRRGLTPAVTGAQVTDVDVYDERALRRHRPVHAAPVSTDFRRQLAGVKFDQPERRGKFLWIPVTDTDTMLLAHLGMSGQLLLRSPDAAHDRHVRVRLWLQHPTQGRLRLDFADQRLFGSLAIDRRSINDSSPPMPLTTVPSQVAHIARDPLDPAFDDDTFATSLRTRNTTVKRALLNQTLVSGIGNIYADETLWLARLHPETSARQLSNRKAHELLRLVREVFARALAEGGTSFDEHYLHVDGQAGYFAHSLKVYGRAGQPCHRCGTSIRREAFMNRSSHFCPRCQRRRSRRHSHPD